VQRWQFGISAASRPLQLALGLIGLRVAAANEFSAVLHWTDFRAHALARHAMRPVLALDFRTQFWKGIFFNRLWRKRLMEEVLCWANWDSHDGLKKKI
jgi:hypothetical protein